MAIFLSSSNLLIFIPSSTFLFSDGTYEYLIENLFAVYWFHGRFQKVEKCAPYIFLCGYTPLPDHMTGFHLFDADYSF